MFYDDGNATPFEVEGNLINLAIGMNVRMIVLQDVPSWTDESSNEGAFVLEQKKNGGSWAVVTSSIGPATGNGYHGD